MGASRSTANRSRIGPSDLGRRSIRPGGDFLPALPLWAPVAIGFSFALALSWIWIAELPAVLASSSPGAGPPAPDEPSPHRSLPTDSAALPEGDHPHIRGIPPLFTPEVRLWSDHILQWSRQYDVPPNLIATVMQIESCGHPSTSSTAGALGLFQVMPFHFQSDEDPFHPQVNARRGLTYLRRSWELAGGDPRLALAGYNGGHGVIPRGPDQWPAETRRYVYWGTGILEDADRGGHQSPRLAAWLAAGGESLCQQAAVALAGGP